MREMNYKKVYVRVRADIDSDGNLTPVALTWANGKVYEIDKVFCVKMRPSKLVGGCGYRYTVRIHGEKRNIYREIPSELFSPRHRWFVEVPVAQEVSARGMDGICISAGV